MRKPEDTLLIVDDNQELLTLFTMIFRKEGYTVQIGRNGKEALAVLSKGPVFHILSDIQMPEMDGKQLLCEVKQRYRHSKVLMMSGDFFDLNEFKLLGALDVVPKPVQIPDLVEKIKEIQGEKRTSVRLPFHLPVTANRTTRGRSVNISGDGILVESTEPIPQDKKVAIDIINPVLSDTITTTGEVVRVGISEAIYLTAVYFQKNIGNLLASHLKGLLTTA
jgi:CheY-like chemotaxis protein